MFKNQNPESGATMIELLIAAAVFLIVSFGVLGLIASSIATNNRNQVDSTQTMLASAIIEQVTSTLIGSGESFLTDCAGTTWTISTEVGGAALAGTAIDFSEASPPADYFMNYVVNTPCQADGNLQAVYDVRWNIEVVGAADGTPTNTYLITVSAQREAGGIGDIYWPAPVTLRTMAGNNASW
jgi:type II secretory pathway pseudopilin PulG